MMNGDAAIQATYEQFIQTSKRLLVVPVNRRVLTEAAQVRAASGIKLPDAIHAATSLLGLCETFLTNDPEFRKVRGLPVIVLDDVLP